jgi:hypothetical protein
VTITPEAVLNLLREQAGRESALKAGEIVEILTNQRSTQSQERQLREICNALCLEGWPICSSSYYGYWWAIDSAEIHETCRSLRSRALSSLTRIGKLKRLAIPLLEGQLLLPIEMAQPQIPEVAWQSHHPALSRIVDIPEGLDRQVQTFIERSGMEQDEFFVNAIVMYLEHLKSHG